MKASIFKTAGLALAVPGLAMAAPAFAAPASHSAAYSNSAVWSDAKAENGRKHRRNYERYNDGRYSNNYGAQQNYYGEPVNANTRVWEGDDGRYYCRKSNGTTGLIIGAAGGALLGRQIAGDRTLGAIIGAAGGALLGRAVQKGASRCR